MVEAGTTPVGYADSPPASGGIIRRSDTLKGTVLICRLSDTLKGTVPACRLSDTLKGEVPIPGADGYAYGGQRDG